MATLDLARRTGGWLGGLALVAAVGLVAWGGLAMLNVLFGGYERAPDWTEVRLDDIASRSDYDVDGLSCSVAEGQARARGVLVSSLEAKQAFAVTVTFRDGAGLDVDRRVFLEAIPPSGRRVFQARTFRNEPVGPDTTCSVELVHRAHLEEFEGNYD
jgi:hypothetical protein